MLPAISGWRAIASTACAATLPSPIAAAKPVNTPIIPLNKAEFNPIEILNIIINSNIGKEISFFIYNIKNGPRIVETKIEKGENDEKFVLGCDVAYGALHGFPFALNENESNMNISKENENKEDKKEEIKCDKENNNNIEEEPLEGNILSNSVKVIAWIKGESPDENSGISILNEGCIPIPDWVKF